MSTEVKDAGEVVSPETGAGAGPSLRGPAVGTPCLEGLAIRTLGSRGAGVKSHRTRTAGPMVWWPAGGWRWEGGSLAPSVGWLSALALVSACRAARGQQPGDQDQPWPLSPGEGWGRSRPSKGTGDF